MRNSHHKAALDRLRALARFGRKASDSLDGALAAICDALQVPMGKVLVLDEDRNVLLVRAGVGWSPGVTGKATVVANDTSIAGYSLTREGVIIFSDVTETRRFTEAHLLRGHGVRSSLAARVSHHGKPWGVLTLHEREQRDFSREEIAFVKAAAIELATLVGTEEREPA